MLRVQYTYDFGRGVRMAADEHQDGPDPGAGRLSGSPEDRIRRVREDRIKRVHGLYDQVAEDADNWARQAKRLEVSNLVFTTLTSGAFWALASDALPKPIGWIGAAISTVTTFLAIYLLSSGLNTKTTEAL
jgi:uncharacterized membrane protein YjjP (DUF1212 family)